MTIDINGILIAAIGIFSGGLATAIYAGKREEKLERIRSAERAQDQLKIDIKDLKIQLYKMEKELTDWKDKYYLAIQELIEIKGELEHALISLSHAEMHSDYDLEDKE